MKSDTCDQCCDDCDNWTLIDDPKYGAVMICKDELIEKGRD